MKTLLLFVVFAIPVLCFAQKDRYLGWWEHRSTFQAEDSIASDALMHLGKELKIPIEKLDPMSETEIQFYEDSFNMKYGISVANGDGDARSFKWFRSIPGTWVIDDNAVFKKYGKRITIRENSFTLNEDKWKDSVVNHSILFTSKNSDIILLKFDDGSKATGLFATQVAYPYIWLYLEYGFGNIYTKYY